MSRRRVFEDIERKVLRLLHGPKTRAHLREIQAHFLRHGLHHLNRLLSHFVSVSASLNRLSYAHKLFLQAPNPDIYLFNSMIKAFSLSGPFQDSFLLFSQMKARGIWADEYTFAPLLKACSALGDFRVGGCVHKEVLVNGFEWFSAVRVGLVEFYAGNGCMDDAWKVFDEMSQRDVIVWNLMVRGFCRAGEVGFGLRLFRRMSERSVVSWNIMISGLGESGRDSEALALFKEMKEEGFEPDEVTLVTVLPIFARLGDLDAGKEIRCYAESSGLMREFPSVGNTLVSFYGKCGMVETAIEVFNQMPKKNGVSWNAMISCLAFHGRDELGVEMFEKMIDEGQVPNEGTYVAALTCCSHAGMVEKGRELFYSMRDDYGIKPTIEHFGCMVDILGRGGFVGEAYDLIRSIPERPNSALWGSLLSSCRSHGELEIAQLALKELIELEPWNSGNYVLLSNMYAEEEKWDEVEKVRLAMCENQIMKVAGQSSIG